MPSVFTRIIDGELPGRFVWKDEHCVAFLSINPVRPGHVLVVPRREVDHWIDLPAELSAHVWGVSQAVGKALQAAFRPAKVGFGLVGLEVNHAHLHLWPLAEMADFDFGRAEADPDAAALDASAEKIRAALREMGCAQVAD